MFKKDWSKGVKKLFSSKGFDPMKMEIAPFRDWRIIVVTFFAGLVISLGFNIYLSIEVNRDNFFTATTVADEGIIFKKDDLAKVLAGLAEKEALFEKVRTEGVSVVDPSI